jgi:hypothetical protein
MNIFKIWALKKTKNKKPKSQKNKNIKNFKKIGKIVIHYCNSALPQTTDSRSYFP